VILQVCSADDPAAAIYRHVGDHTWLRERGLFVAEGRLIVTRLLLGARYPVESVVVTPPALKALHPLVATLDAPVLVAPPLLLAEIAGFDFHRGCLAIARRLPADGLAEVSTAARLLGLESVGNPDNVGGLFRTAAAFGARVIVDERTGDPFYRKALRTSMGAVLDLPFTRVTDWLATFERVRAKGRTVVALTPEPSAEPLADFVATLADRPLILMVGAEGPGLSVRVLEAADRRVRIPIASHLDSLNVTTAAAIALARIAEVHAGRARAL
jgi:tRNA G18 (ribose-2'-O)-methylase SpoU